MHSVSNGFRSFLQTIKRHPVYSGIVGVLLLVLTATVSVAGLKDNSAPNVVTSSADAAVRSAATSKSGSNGSVDPAPLAQTHKVTGQAEVTQSTTAKPTPIASQQPVKTTVKPAPSQSGTCLECGGDPDKVPSRKGLLVLSGTSINVPAGGIGTASLTARSDTGEKITTPFALYSAGSPMITSSPAGTTATQVLYADVQPFRFVAPPDTAIGSYTFKIVASGINGGSYSGQVTVNIVAPN